MCTATQQLSLVCKAYLKACQQEIATRIVAQGATYLQEKKAAEAAKRAVEEARELKEYRSQLTFKVCIFSLLWAQYLRE